MPCMSLAWDLESLPMIWPSLGRWISTPRSSRGDAIAEIAIQAVGLLHQHYAADGMFFQEAHHFAELLASGGLGGSTSINSRRMVRLCLPAYSRSSFNWAGMEKPSRSCSRLDTRAYRTPCLIAPPCFIFLRLPMPILFNEIGRA